MKEKQYAVIGLGIFGSTISKTLSQYGFEVIAVDKNVECVERVSEYVTQGVIGDATDLEFLKNIGIADVDVAVVAIGNHLEESILSVLNLKELGVPYIIAKAKNKQFKAVLEKIGADRVVRPEKEMGQKIAKSLMRNNIIDLIEIDDSYSIVEMKVPPQWVGHTLTTLHLRNRYGINILGKKDHLTHKIEFSINPNAEIMEDDIYLMVAETSMIERLDFFGI